MRAGTELMSTTVVARGKRAELCSERVGALLGCAWAVWMAAASLFAVAVLLASFFQATLSAITARELSWSLPRPFLLFGPWWMPIIVWLVVAAVVPLCFEGTRELVTCGWLIRDSQIRAGLRRVGVSGSSWLAVQRDRGRWYCRLREERSDIRGQGGGLFHPGEVAASVELGPVGDVVDRLYQAPQRLHLVVGKHCDTGRVCDGSGGCVPVRRSHGRSGRRSLRCP